MRCHFLHIRKTGGTAIKQALEPFAQPRAIVLHPHRVTLQDIPQGEQVFFVLRHPLTRFVSGFYSRLRKGLPRHFSEWSDGERAAFHLYSTPNDLAEALSDPARGKQAEHAMRSIRHVQTHLTDWIGGVESVQARRSDILLIAFQETLDEDFARLVSLLGLPRDLALPRDDVGAHRTPSAFDRTLSDRARENLTAWYRDDLNLYNHLWQAR